MSASLAIVVVFTGILFVLAVADEYARRKNRKASEALNQRHRIGL